MSNVKLLADPLPFPTIPIDYDKRSDRPGIQQNWVAVVVVLHLVFFLLFVGLLIYYVWFVKTPGKRLVHEQVGEDGFSDDEDSDEEEEEEDEEDEEYYDDGDKSHHD